MKECHLPEQNVNNCHHCNGYRSPWISRVFDVLGVIFIGLGIVMLLMTIFSETTEIFALTLISVFGSGFAYTAIAEILRSMAETAYNTREILKLQTARVHQE